MKSEDYGMSANWAPSRHFGTAPCAACGRVGPAEMVPARPIDDLDGRVRQIPLCSGCKGRESTPRRMRWRLEEGQDAA